MLMKAVDMMDKYQLWFFKQHHQGLAKDNLYQY